jgi:hypothetical protein
MRTLKLIVVPFVATTALGLLLTNCASREASKKKDDVTPLPADARLAPVTHDTSEKKRRWIAGDLHIHPAPFDTREGASLTIKDLPEKARVAGLEWMIVTPHIRPATWKDRSARRRWISAWTTMAQESRLSTLITIIPGAEFTQTGYGHFGVSGIDLAKVGDDFLASATTQGGFIVVNHPFATPTHIPGVSVSESDLSFHPWTKNRGQIPYLDGVEVWNIPLSWANVVSKTAGGSGEDLAFVAAEKIARSEQRAIAVVGGSDTHGQWLAATTWVLAADSSATSILSALKNGATCVRGPQAGTLEAHGDGEPMDHWATIGETTHAASAVELRWQDVARLFIDGADVGEHNGSYVHRPTPQKDSSGSITIGTHTYRIAIGASRCGFVLSMSINH